MSTEIATLFSSDSTPEPETKDAEILSDDNLSKSIMDFSLSLETRIKAIDAYYVKEGGNNTVETINKLAVIYEMSGTRQLRTYLYTICEKSNIEPFLKSLLVKALYSHNPKDELAFKAIDLVYPMLGADIGTPFKIEFVKMLANSSEYLEKAKNYFCAIIEDDRIDCEFRFKSAQSMEENLFILTEAYLCFIKNERNKLLYRILAGQSLLQRCKLKDGREIEVERILLGIAKNESYEYNTRADATDVLLQLGTQETKAIAKEIMLRLGVGNKNIINLYDNAQNVHTKEIEESVNEALEFLQTFNILKHNGSTITVDFVEQKVKEIVKEEKNSEKEGVLTIAFNRIVMDRALYSKYNCTLSHILLQVWTYLTGHDSEAEMKKRLIEELVDMAGTCSSGFATRLINTISGFGNFSMKISWQDQIVSNITGRLNARIRDMDNLTLQEKVLEEMTIPSSDYQLRKNFLKFFRRTISTIREEMYQEFKDYISDEDYDLYFRKAVIMYETGTM
jgi:hypothetical protein